MSNRHLGKIERELLAAKIEEMIAEAKRKKTKSYTLEEVAKAAGIKLPKSKNDRTT